MVTLYKTITCPMCSTLQKKLSASGKQFTVCTDVKEMERKGLWHLPVLEVDGTRMTYKEALAWING